MANRNIISFLFFFWSIAINSLMAVPVITSISDHSGPAEGGTPVTITGSGFTGVFEVYFDSELTFGYTIVSDNVITATSPPHAPQTVFIRLRNDDGFSEEVPAAYFVYQGNAQININLRDSGVGGQVAFIDTLSDSVLGTSSTVNMPSTIINMPDWTYTMPVSQQDDYIAFIRQTNFSTYTQSAVGSSPIAAAVSPDGLKIYVVNQDSNDVTPIDATNQFTNDPISVGENPVAVAFTPDSSKAFVANQGALLAGSVSVINALTDSVITTIDMPGNPVAIALTPDGSKAYVVNNAVGAGSVSIIDVATNSMIGSINIQNAPAGISVANNGRAYVNNVGSNSVSVIDTINDVLIAHLAMNEAPISLAVTPNGSKIYVGTLSPGAIHFIDAFTLIHNTIFNEPSQGYLAAAVTPDGQKVYFSDYSGKRAVVIDTSSNAVTTIDLGNQPLSIAIPPDPAPLARFNATLANAGQPSQFDASASSAPIGGIANYFWDFGDGTTQSTAQPVITHTYAQPGNYHVSLAVTSAGGTSTASILRYTSNLMTGFNATNTSSLLNFGKPSAFTSQGVSIGSGTDAVPLNLVGRRMKNKFATQTDYIHALTWDPPIGFTPAVYLIYRNDLTQQPIGNVFPNEKLEYKDHNRRKRETDTYYVVAVSLAGQRSLPAEVTIR
ncbi:MAG: PKD domain-containing protein [Parachlamydiaceae bacterium]